MPESATVFVCPELGCTKMFARFSDFELHLDVGEHVSQNKLADLQHNIYDKLKRNWVAIFAKVQTKERQPQHCQIDSTCAQREKSVPEVNMGWTLAKARSGSDQFSENLKEYLTKKFDKGEKTGQKASAEQVAKEMCSTRTHDNQKVFGREEWLAKVQGFFSCLTFSRRKQGWHGAETSKEDDEGDGVGKLRQAVEEVIENLGLKHPILFDVYNLCQYYHSNKLSSFNVSMLKDMCGYFEIPFKSRDPERDLLAKVSGVVKECECSKE